MMGRWVSGLVMVALPFILFFSISVNAAENDAAAEKRLGIINKNIETAIEKKEYGEAIAQSIEGIAFAENQLGPEHLAVGFFFQRAAILYVLVGQQNNALSMALRELQIFEKNVTVPQFTVAATLVRIGDILIKLTKVSDALVYFNRALVIIDKGTEKNENALAFVLSRLGEIYYDQNKYNESVTAYVRCLLSVEKTYGRKHSEVAKILNYLGLAYYHSGDYQGAYASFIRAIEINTLIFGDMSVETLQARSNLGVTLRTLGKLEESILVLRKVIALSEDALGLNHVDTAFAMNLLAQSYIYLNNDSTAIEINTKAVAIYEKQEQISQRRLAIALGDMVISYNKMGMFEEAVQAGLRSLQLNERVLDAFDEGIAISLSGLGQSYLLSGNYEKALPMLARAHEITSTKYGDNNINSALSFNNYGYVVGLMGNYEAALKILHTSYAVQEKIIGNTHKDTALTLNNIGFFNNKLQRYEQAAIFLELSVGGQNKINNVNDLNLLKNLGNLAWSYHGLGRHREAFNLENKVLSGFEKAYGESHPDSVIARHRLAATGFLFGNKDVALPALWEAFFRAEAFLGPSNPETLDIALSLGRFLKILRQDEQSSLFYKIYINGFQNLREQVSLAAKNDLASFTASSSNAYTEAASLLIDLGLVIEAQQVLDMLKEEEQFDFIRRTATADPRKTKLGYTSSEQLWLGRYRQIADQLGRLVAEQRELEKQAKLGLTPAQKSRQQALEGDLKVAQAAFEAFLSQMREGFVKAGPARKIEVEEVSAQSMREIQGLLKGLGDDVALLQYYITDKRVGMLLTTPSIQLARSSEIDAKDLNRKIDELRRLLQDPKSNPQPAAQALYEILVAPVAKDLDDLGAKNIMLSLDGALRYLPFGALHDGKQYLAQRWNLPIYTSVTKNRLRDAVAPQWQAAGLGVTREWPEFKPLAGVRAEMGAIVKTATGGLMPGEVYLDDAFTALRLRDVSQRQFPVLHVASHFRFSPGTEVNSFLLLGDGARLTLGDIRTQNYRFDNVDLLTLSACDTGLGGGRDEQGKEIEGFGVIAQQQGAKAVLATLWPVADQSTAALMADMYRRRQGLSLSKIEALRQAQLALQTQPKYAHPYYWAPFILMGNWK